MPLRHGPSQQEHPARIVRAYELVERAVSAEAPSVVHTRELHELELGEHAEHLVRMVDAVGVEAQA